MDSCLNITVLLIKFQEEKKNHGWLTAGVTFQNGKWIYNHRIYSALYLPLWISFTVTQLKSGKSWFIESLKGI